MKNHHKERRDDIDDIVRKLVTCCHGNFTRENKAKEGSGSNDWSDNCDMDASRDDADISEILSENKGISDNCGDVNVSGISCNVPKINIDSSSIRPKKSMRRRQRSVTLQDYLVPKNSLELDPSHVEETNENSKKKSDDTYKSRMGLAHKQASNPKLKRTFPARFVISVLKTQASSNDK